MTRDESLALTAEIAGRICSGSLTVEYSDEEAEQARRAASTEQLRRLRAAGLLEYSGSAPTREEWERYYVTDALCRELSLYDRASGDYLRELFTEARRFTPRQLYSDPYMLDLSIPLAELGRFSLRYSGYDRGEIFQRDMPQLGADIVVPKLGFFTEEVVFPAVYEGVIPWVSVCPSEIVSMRPQIAAAHGRVLVLGLGLGYYAYLASLSESVEHVTVIELQSEIVQLFSENILPQMRTRDKIDIVTADAIEYLASLRGDEYDFCFADIWEGLADGAPLYKKIKEQEARLGRIEFTYWIEEQLREYLHETEE